MVAMATAGWRTIVAMPRLSIAISLIRCQIAEQLAR
jgi:hypothetical protein